MNNIHLLERFILYKVNKCIASSKNMPYEQYVYGSKLKILLIGYSGKRNAGAEIRCAEIIKQIKNLHLSVNVCFGVLTLNPEESKPYYMDDVELIKISSVFFKDLLKSCSEYHIGILAEGSCLTSVTSNVAALFFICAAGILKSQNKLCIGYGVEAGPMPKLIKKAVREHCSDSYFIARTKNSMKTMSELGINVDIGTDTAWTADAHSNAWACNEMHKLFNYDSVTPLIGISPMNPYIRPIYPSISRYLKGIFTNNWHGHYDKFYFYTTSKERQEQYFEYVHAIKDSVINLLKSFGNGAIPIYIEMEPMDHCAVEDIRKIIGIDGHIISAKNYNGSEITALLRSLSILITSRYHAHVLTIPSGVPTIGISKDSRLTDIFSENELSEYCISTNDKHLRNNLSNICESASLNKDTIKMILLGKHKTYLDCQYQMGLMLRDKINTYIKVHAPECNNE